MFYIHIQTPKLGCNLRNLSVEVALWCLTMVLKRPNEKRYKTRLKPNKCKSEAATKQQPSVTFHDYKLVEFDRMFTACRSKQHGLGEKREREKGAIEQYIYSFTYILNKCQIKINEQKSKYLTMLHKNHVVNKSQLVPRNHSPLIL